ncbi:hypothetical protein IMG5_138720 [Ichthyophthirius multifiliis]|uniref:Uncharacterized protein n=1 Tax=Ichthyophthirius multifiliis TaxID=5932 RepID=G0QX69_ICHMU|nr:hypothetical protein IMG5_138720 [Ichthyophthirius multifiliis]EGR30186.1 hypothetical protein IMG5_138720 [Ichthyophthirius multifiliis]|eukprot:XP_004031778.1 hypothetical protein IMG5_138720 [Ichthyophthirius multifiliis]
MKTLNQEMSIVVAKLPFEPFYLLQSLTHRGLIGNDMTDCAYIFIYVQSAYIWRTNIQKYFGFEPPQNKQNAWGQQGFGLQK